MQTKQNMDMLKKILLLAAIGICLCAAILIAENYGTEANAAPQVPAVAVGFFPHKLPPLRTLPHMPHLRPILRQT